MRQIKFRYYDTENKVMVYDGMPLPQPTWVLHNRLEEPYGNYILMQYTGLHDKNGKEIYEGDIVKCNFAWGDNVCEIVEEKGCYWVSQKNREIEDQAHDNLYWHNEGCEIIGNIYSNPDLLPVKE